MINKNEISVVKVVGLMFIAYCFSIAMRLIWVYQFQDNPNFIWDNQMMINTNDGYFFASGAQHVLTGFYEHNPRIPNIWAYGTVAITAFFTAITPFSLETVTLYMPAVVSSLVVIPIILIARLYNLTLWGFLAALLGSIAWSYYNRTMVGYYDTDMFSAMAPMFILYFLMKSTIDFNLRSALYAALFITIYPFLYDAGKAVIFAMGIMYALYLLFYHHRENMAYSSLILVFVALIPMPLILPYNYLAKIVIIMFLYFFLTNTSIEKKKLMGVSIILFFMFMYFGNVFSLILNKVLSYVSTGTASEGLHFYGVKQTVREAGKIPFETFANRISGSQVGVIISFIGYVALVLRHRPFILALPLIGIGVFALWGGLRFTVYAVPVAAMSAIYLLFILGSFFKDDKLKYLFIVFATVMMIYPNVTHIIAYKVPTVLNKAEVNDLDNLKKISSTKDYTISWWDYGYPIWYYSNTNTLIDGGKHNNDNFIISKVMQTSSPELAASLSRLAVETYVDSNYTIVANTLFSSDGEKKVDSNLLIAELENGTYELPQKTRDIYLYLPYRMMRIFPTVAVFGNLDLNTGKAKRKITFYQTSVAKEEKGILTLRNGIIFDSHKGQASIGDVKKKVKFFIVTQNTKDGKIKHKPRHYQSDGELAIVYMQSYGQMIVMDMETFNSIYVQMFILGKYDKNLFELVISSAYSKIYKLK